MASSFACRACRRALQQNASSFTQASRNRATPSLRASFSIASRAAQQQSQQSLHSEAPSSPAALENNDALTAQQEQRSTPGNAYASARAGAPSHAAMSRSIAQGLHKRAGTSTETYVAYGGTEMLFRECARQADYKILKDEDGDARKTEKGEDLGVGEGWWYEGLGLTPTFNTWAQVTFLHMYALTTRIRQFPKEYAPAWHQHLIDHFFYEAENRMVIHHNMQARGIRNKYLHDLFIQWRGVMAAYDEGLVKGDAVLATALWRNIWKAEKINPVGLATLVSYLRREVQRLEQISDEAFTSGEVQFVGPEKEEVLVVEQSPQLERPFTAEDLEPKEETKS